MPPIPIMFRNNLLFKNMKSQVNSYKNLQKLTSPKINLNNSSQKTMFVTNLII